MEFSQKPGMHSVWEHGRFGKIHTKTKVLFPQLRRFGTGADFLMIQGWSLALVEFMMTCGLADGHFRFLAGNSFELGAVSAALISALVHMPRFGDEGGGVNDGVNLEDIVNLFGIPAI